MERWTKREERVANQFAHFVGDICEIVDYWIRPDRRTRRRAQVVNRITVIKRCAISCRHADISVAIRVPEWCGYIAVNSPLAEEVGVVLVHPKRIISVELLWARRHTNTRPNIIPSVAVPILTVITKRCAVILVHGGVSGHG